MSAILHVLKALGTNPEGDEHLLNYLAEAANMPAEDALELAEGPCDPGALMTYYARQQAEAAAEFVASEADDDADAEADDDAEDA